MADPIDIVIGGRIRAARRAGGLTQAEVAAAAGLTRSSIANVENGRQRMPVSTLVDIADAIGLTIGELVERDAPPAPMSARHKRLVAALRATERRLAKTCEEIAELLATLDPEATDAPQ